MAIRAVERRLDRPLAVLADLQGPKLRVARLAEPRGVESGDELVLAAHGHARDGDLELGFDLDMAKYLGRGRRCMIDDGRVRLRVEQTRGRRCAARSSRRGGPSQKGVNLPGSYLPFPSVTDRGQRTWPSPSSTTSTSWPSRSCGGPRTWRSCAR